MIAKVSSYGVGGVAADVRVLDNRDVSSSVSAATYAAPKRKRAKESTPKAPVVPEKRVKEQVRKVLKALGIWYCTPIGAGFGPAAHDFVCCVPVTTDTGMHYGQLVSIETKATNGKLRPRQIETVKAVQDAHGIVLVIYPENIPQLTPALTAVMRGDFPARGA